MSEQTTQPSAPQGFFDGNPKQMFVFGVVTGMVAILLMNNFTGISLAANGTGGSRAPIVADSGDSENTDPAPSGTLAAVQPDEHIRGDISKAKVVLVEYSDFQCPFCARHDPTMQKIVAEYGDQVAWVYRHFPLTSIHQNAEPTALASECASEQNKFWEFADAVFASQESISSDAVTASKFYVSTAKSLGLDLTKFNSCVSSKKYQTVVDADAASGQEGGVTGTPATFVNGTMVSGAVPYETFKSMIDDALTK